MKKTFLTKEQAEAIAREYPTPFYIYDEKGIRENARRVQEAFSWNKGFREYFAVKALPNPAVMQIMKEEGCGFDCASETELILADAVGAKTAEIMFSSNDTPEAEFACANTLGAIINLDDITHIETLRAACEKGGTDASGNRIAPSAFPETICCRYNPGGVFEMANGIMDHPGDSKYGMTKAQLFQAYRRLKELGAKRFGLHAFLASNTVGGDYYPQLAARLFQIAVEIKEQTGIALSFINLSGGVGIPYRPNEQANDILAIGAGVRRQFESILEPTGLQDIAIYTEMGRFMTGPYGALITRVIHEKHIYKEYIGVDACAANLIRPAMYDAYHHITVLGKEEEPADHMYDVVGSLCENNDKFAIDRHLPEIVPGDLLYLHDAGAHSFSMGYNYNGKLWCAELLLKEDGAVSLIRRAQTPNDYFSTLDVLPQFKLTQP
ncbi:MAG: diaminopimelate decarboxylase [Lachnospiraceae bacterium]|nr:diaminopimelate decarboxylase [Lachnospiraceae bacterium]